MGKAAEVILYAEDPGAANFMAPVAEALNQGGRQTLLWARAWAHQIFMARGLNPLPPPKEAPFWETPPRLLIVGTAEDPDTLGLRLVAEARRAGVTSVGLVDARINAAYRFRGRADSPLALAPDWLLVPDQTTAGDYVALGFPPEKVVACGHPHWDQVRRQARRWQRENREALRRRLLPHRPPGRKVIVFAAEISTGFTPGRFRRSPQYTLRGRGGRHERTAIVLEEVLDALKSVRPRPWFVLRLHPKNRPEEFADYRREIDQVSQGGDPLPLLHAADLVVGLTTMLLLEAALMGRPTLSVVPRAREKDWLPSAACGITPCAHTPAQVQSLLYRQLFQPRLPTPRQLRHHFPPGAVDNVVRLLEKLG